MSFGSRMRQRREALGMSRDKLAQLLGVTRSAIGNYETGVSTPKEEIMLRILHALNVDPNYLYQDDFRSDAFTCDAYEQLLIQKYRTLSLAGRQAVTSVLDTLCGYQADMERMEAPEEIREIPLYRCPAAAGYPAPVAGEDFDMIPVSGEVPRGAEFAVRIQGDSMEPYLTDGGLAYVNRDPLQNGDVGIFCVDGEMLCKQYYKGPKDPLGMVYLFSLNRRRADADVVLPPDSGRTLICFGRVMLPSRPSVPGRE